VAFGASRVGGGLGVGPELWGPLLDRAVTVAVADAGGVSPRDFVTIILAAGRASTHQAIPAKVGVRVCFPGWLYREGVFHSRGY
jgi:hypothetical protein